MTSEWLGLILAAWLASPDGAVRELGDDSFHRREAASALSALVLSADGQDPELKWRFVKAHKEAVQDARTDREVVKRAERLLQGWWKTPAFAVGELRRLERAGLGLRDMDPREVEFWRRRFSEPQGVDP